MNLIRIWWMALVMPLMLMGVQAAHAALTVSPGSITLAVGSKAILDVGNASGQVRVSTSNTRVVTAAYSEGKVVLTGRQAGSATVTIRDRRSTVRVPVTVTSTSRESSNSSETSNATSTSSSEQAPSVEASTLTVSPGSVTMTLGTKTVLTVAGASGRLSVSSSNTRVVTAAYSSGKITLTARAAGNANITVRDSRNRVTVPVTVTRSALSVSPGSVTLAPGAKTSLSVSNASGGVTAFSSNTNVVAAEFSNGVVLLEAHNTGSANVTVRDSATTVIVPVTVTGSTGSGSGGGTGGGGGTPLTGTYTLLAWNDLGMHCMDGDFSVFSILPPYNNLHAQLVDSSNNKLVVDPAGSGITMTYEAMADASGSINSISSTKTNFWTYAKYFFGVDLPIDMGLAGNPTATMTPAPLTFAAASGQFIAEGIPMTPYDDAMVKNPYPMVKVVARDATGKQVAQARVVLPVSDEMSCAVCHAPGSADAAKPKNGWITDANAERAYKLNILSLHDDKQLGSSSAYMSALDTLKYDSAGLLATAQNGKPILCASCHASNALPGTGIAGIKPLTEALHAFHSMVVDPASKLPLDSINNRSACYQCHPGSKTKCLRGVMGNATLADGSMAIQCQSCHGTMSNVGRSGRAGWFDEPDCQACHHDGQRELSAVSSTGILKVWLDTRFATNPNTPAANISLYRFSKGHGNLQCEACHGATHAEYPSSHANDNVLAKDTQGFEGTISECTACHKSVPMTATGGPHGLHTVGSAWVSGHQSYAKSNRTACAYCHGADYRGSGLSTAKKARSFSIEGRTVNIAAGQKVGCYDCHNGPSGD